MAAKRKHDLTTPKGREKIFNEIIDHLLRYNWEELQWIAEESEVCTATLYNWYAGYTISPQIRTLASVARTLGYDIILKRTQPRPPRLRLIKGGKSKRKRR